MRRKQTLLFVCSELPCFSLVLNFDKLRLLLRSVSLLSRGQGRRDVSAMPGEGGRGEGLRELRGVGGQGERARAEGYKYPPDPDDHTVSQLETYASTLAGHLATLTP